LKAGADWQDFVFTNRSGLGYQLSNYNVVTGPVLGNPGKKLKFASDARAVDGFDQQGWFTRDAINLLKLIK